MKSKKTKLAGFVVALSLSLTAVSSAFAAASELSDVPKTHWAYSTIVWAASNNVVKGYPDGTFRPNKEVSEAEFLMMFVSAYQKVSPISGQTHWADPVYTVAKGYNWPVTGVKNDAAGKVARDTPITRGEVANIIAGANGINYMGNNAIQYLLNTNLSGGKTSNTVAGYKATDKLTRAEAVAFIKKAKDAGLTELKERPTLPTSVSEMPKPVTSLPTGISDVKNTITKVVSNYPGYTILTSSTGVSLKNAEGYPSVSYSVAESAGENNRVISFDATNTDSLKLATEMLKAAGVNVPANFTATLESAVQSGQTSNTTIDGYTVIIRPSATNMDQVTISFKTSVSEMPKPVTSLPTGISDVKNTITKVVSNYPGYTVKAGDTGVSIYDNEGYASINYKVAESAGGNNRVISFDATNNDSLKLATEMLKAAGVNVPANFTATLESAVQSGKASSTTIGGYTVYISPSDTNMDQITISFKKP